jgi:hypothetical protein
MKIPQNVLAALFSDQRLRFIVSISGLFLTLAGYTVLVAFDWRVAVGVFLLDWGKRCIEKADTSL